MRSGVPNPKLMLITFAPRPMAYSTASAILRMSYGAGPSTRIGITFTRSVPWLARPATCVPCQSPCGLPVSLWPSTKSQAWLSSTLPLRSSSPQLPGTSAGLAQPFGPSSGCHMSNPLSNTAT